MDRFDRFSKSFREGADMQDDPNSKSPRRIKRYLEGWETQTVIDEKGRYKKVGVYVGNYYKPDEPKQKYVLRKLAYIIAIAAVGAVFVYCASRNIPVNSEGFMAICQTVSLCALGWMFVSAIGYAIGPYEMTEYDYRSGSKGLIKSGLFAAFGIAASAVGYLVYGFMHSGELQIVFPIAAVLVLMACILWEIRRCEKKLVYISRSAKKTNESAFSFEE